MSNKSSASIAFLIDADNLTPHGVDEAMRHLQRLGSVSIRRAYGGLEKLVGMRDMLREHSIQAMVNQGKGTTDVALVVDAMDLLHRNMLATTVAIGSSDADFAPLAVRFREAGIRVICFAQKENAADALPRSFDEVIFVNATARTTPVHIVPPASTLGDAKNEIQQNLRPPEVAPEPTLSSLMPASVQASVAPTLAEETLNVKRILKVLPGWLPNTIKQLNQLGTPLRASGVKKGNAPLHELFKKYPTYFKVLPMTGAPKQVRLLKIP